MSMFESENQGQAWNTWFEVSMSYPSKDAEWAIRHMDLEFSINTEVHGPILAPSSSSF